MNFRMFASSLSWNASVLSKKRAAAFSLVEVVLALGVMSFCLLTVIGLLPVGLTTLRDAAQQTVEGQIVQRVGSQMQLTQFTQLDDHFGGKVFYFDDEGTPSSSKPTVGYQVSTAFGVVNYPGSSAAPSESPITANIRTLEVEVVKLPAAKSTNRFNLAVANSGS